VQDNRIWVSMRICQASRDIVWVRCSSATALSGSSSSTGYCHLPFAPNSRSIRSMRSIRMSPRRVNVGFTGGADSGPGSGDNSAVYDLLRLMTSSGGAHRVLNLVVGLQSGAKGLQV
jgi:hypothetical protein